MKFHKPNFGVHKKFWKSRTVKDEEDDDVLGNSEDDNDDEEFTETEDEQNEMQANLIDESLLEDNDEALFEKFD